MMLSGAEKGTRYRLHARGPVSELRLNARHEGEGKTSLTGNVAIDSSAQTIALEDYEALPIALEEVQATPYSVVSLN